jgi:hypothetical protein
MIIFGIALAVLSIMGMIYFLYDLLKRKDPYSVGVIKDEDKDKIPIIEGEIPPGTSPYIATLNAAFKSKSAVSTKFNDDGTVEMIKDDKSFVGDSAADAANKLLNDSEEKREN